ncbi:MAG: PaaI family thioesterase [Chloroflexi bacterium]|jgi:acyl-CoA thioesterase|nr:PaaI family thioesterase [Chloroflexota bacterium]
MDNIRAFMRRDRFALHTGIELLEVEEGRAKARLILQPHHLNGVRIAHGGAIFTLADLAFAAASNSYGTVAVGINVSISYVKAVSEGALLAEAQETSRSSRLATYTVRVTDEAGDLVAIFQGMVYRKAERLPEAGEETSARGCATSGS